MVGVKTGTDTLVINVEIPQKHKNRCNTGSTYNTLRYILKGTYVLLKIYIYIIYIISIYYSNTYLCMFIVTIFAIISKLKQPMEYCSPIKIMKYTGKWMVLETIILDDVTQTQKNKHHMFFLIYGC